MRTRFQFEKLLPNRIEKLPVYTLTYSPFKEKNYFYPSNAVRCMKHLLLIAFLFAGSFCSAQVPQGTTQTTNNAAIAAGKTALNAKIVALEAAYAANPASASSVQTTDEVLKMMRADMRLAKYSIYLESDKSKQATLNKDFYVLEAAQHSFFKLSSTPATNHAELVKQAKAFSALL